MAASELPERRHPRTERDFHLALSLASVSLALTSYFVYFVMLVILLTVHTTLNNGKRASVYA